MSWQVVEGDCVEQMQAMEEASVDAIVTDPLSPYGLEFMGKEWDRLAGDFGQPSERREPIPGHRSGSGETERPTGRTNIYSTENTTALPRYHAGKTSQAWHQAWATEALRVLKPGGHLLAFGGSRTFHRLACAIEDAGFEIRDRILCLRGGDAVELGPELDWIYGSG